MPENGCPNSKGHITLPNKEVSRTYNFQSIWPTNQSLSFCLLIAWNLSTKTNKPIYGPPSQSKNIVQLIHRHYLKWTTLASGTLLFINFFPTYLLSSMYSLVSFFLYNFVPFTTVLYTKLKSPI